MLACSHIAATSIAPEGIDQVVLDPGFVAHCIDNCRRCDPLRQNGARVWIKTDGAVLAAPGDQRIYPSIGSLRWELIVGGSFSLAGDQEAHNIARWDGSEWKPLAEGTDPAALCDLVDDGQRRFYIKSHTVDRL
jgi:hypothetical protein